MQRLSLDNADAVGNPVIGVYDYRITLSKAATHRRVTQIALTDFDRLEFSQAALDLECRSLIAPAKQRAQRLDQRVVLLRGDDPREHTVVMPKPPPESWLGLFA